jgi:hypothetical protein
MIKTVILVNGLLMYQPAVMTPLASLAARFEDAGWNVCVDNHFNTKCKMTKVDLVIGHSQGGKTAIELAWKLRPPLVVTFDAVRMRSCPPDVRCVNFRTRGYPNVQGAQNIAVNALHATMVYNPTLQEMVFEFAKPIPEKVEVVDKPVVKEVVKAKKEVEPEIEEVVSLENLNLEDLCKLLSKPDPLVCPKW